MPKKIEGINVVPFIDIILVLLVIVLMEATFIQTDGINLPASQEASESVSVQQEALTFAITKEGEILLDSEKVSIQEIPQKLAKASKEQAIHIRGDSQSEFATFVALLGSLKGLGFTNLSIITEKKD